jgi:hypothetical protein
MRSTLLLMLPTYLFLLLLLMLPTYLLLLLLLLRVG